MFSCFVEFTHTTASLIVRAPPFFFIRVGRHVDCEGELRRYVLLTSSERHTLAVVSGQERRDEVFLTTFTCNVVWNRCCSVLRRYTYEAVFPNGVDEKVGAEKVRTNRCSGKLCCKERDLDDYEKVFVETALMTRKNLRNLIMAMCL